MPSARIEAIVAEKDGIDGDTAIRLGRLFGATPQLWMSARALH